MQSSPSVRVLEVEPDIARFLPAAQQEEAARLTVPVLEVEKGQCDIDAVLGEDRAFGGIILDGMLLQRLRVGDQPGLRLLGPGDIVSVSGTQRTALLTESGYRVAATARRSATPRSGSR